MGNILFEAEKKNLISVQALRGIASLLVALCHISGMVIGTFHKEFCFNIFRFGETGVDIFFVISGFIITYTSIKTINQKAKFWNFVKKRMIRIYPTYWIIITGLILLQISLPSFYNFPYILNTENIISTYLLLPDHPKIIVLTWTLTYELFFYALFSLGFIFHNRKGRIIVLTVYALVIIVIAVTGVYVQFRSAWTDIITSPMVIEFLMGVLSALVISKMPDKAALPLLISGTFIFLFLGSIVSMEKYHSINLQLSNHTLGRVLMFGVPSFLILTGLVKYERFKKFSVPGILFSLGEASYSLYLIHLPAFAAAFKFLARLNIQNIYLLHLAIVITVSAVCLISVVFYNQIEKPVMRVLNNIGKRNKEVAGLPK